MAKEIFEHLLYIKDTIFNTKIQLFEVLFH